MPHYHRADSWPRIVQETGQRRGVARYIHTLNPVEIQQIEEECIRSGHEIAPDRMVFWREFDRVIGASSGEETEFVRVEITSNIYHGRPVTQAEIRREIRANET